MRDACLRATPLRFKPSILPRRSALLWMGRDLGPHAYYMAHIGPYGMLQHIGPGFGPTGLYGLLSGIWGHLKCAVKLFGRRQFDSTFVILLLDMAPRFVILAIVVIFFGY